MYLRSDYYTNDERWEITGRAGYARVNRCTGRGIQQPSLEVYLDGEMRSYHALDDDWGSSFRDSGRHWLRWLHTGEGPMLWSGEEAMDVLRFALAAYASSAAGGTGVDPASVSSRSAPSAPAGATTSGDRQASVRSLRFDPWSERIVAASLGRRIGALGPDGAPARRDARRRLAGLERLRVAARSHAELPAPRAARGAPFRRAADRAGAVVAAQRHLLPPAGRADRASSAAVVGLCFAMGASPPDGLFRQPRAARGTTSPPPRCSTSGARRQVPARPRVPAHRPRRSGRPSTWPD